MYLIECTLEELKEQREATLKHFDKNDICDWNEIVQERLDYIDDLIAKREKEPEISVTILK